MRDTGFFCEKFRLKELYRGYVGLMEGKMETTIILGLYRGYIGIIEKNMEVTIMGYRFPKP